MKLCLTPKEIREVQTIIHRTKELNMDQLLYLQNTIDTIISLRVETPRSELSDNELRMTVEINEYINDSINQAFD